MRRVTKEEKYGILLYGVENFMDSNEKNHVLIVDDEKMNIEILASILRSEYAVYMAKNGASAIEMAHKYSPDIILLDVIMPDMNGFDVLAVLKASEKTRNIPVIITTGLNSVEDEEKGLRLGAVDFIHKPFSAGVVQLRVRNQMLLVKLQQDLENLKHEGAVGILEKTESLAATEHKNGC